MKEEKLLNIITILIIIALLVYYLITNSIPEFKKTFGSSDKIIKTSEYENLVNVNINNNINFGLVINNKKEIYHIYFYEDNSLILYNQNIENNKFNKALDKVVVKLIENDYLKEGATITLTKYNTKYYNDLKNSLMKVLNKYKVHVTLKEETSDILSLAAAYELDDTDQTKILLELDLLLKNQTKINKEEQKEEITEKDLKKYCNNIYMSIESYQKDNRIINEEKNKNKLDITKISALEGKNIFPTKDSYYYIKDSKVYAYIKIEFDAKSAEYCYNGSIDEYKVGVC